MGLRSTQTPTIHHHRHTSHKSSPISFTPYARSLGGEVRLSRQQSSIRGLLTRASISSSLAARTARARRLGVLSRSAIAGAGSRRASAARAAGSGHGVLGAGLFTVAAEGGLLAAGAGGLLGADAATAFRAAAAGSGDDHGACKKGGEFGEMLQVREWLLDGLRRVLECRRVIVIKQIRSMSYRTMVVPGVRC